MDTTDVAAGFVSETNNTTIASLGTTSILHAHAWNIRTGLELWFPPGAQHLANQGNTTMVVRLMAAPVDSLTMSGSLYVEEQ